jgi:nucleoside-diphosphate-sugar epimerase
MKWLLTGCNGFIAKNFIDYFNEVELIGLDLAPSMQIPTIIQDASLPIQGVYDLIVHAASGYQDDVAMFNANFLGTKRCIEAASRNNCPLLYVSSAEAYQPVRTYGIMKLAGECLIKTYNKGYIVRPFHIYGPNMNLNDGRVQSSILRSLRFKETFHMRGTGSAIRCFTHVRDLLAAMELVVAKGVPGLIYDVTNEEESTSIEDLCKCLKIAFTTGTEEHPIKSSIGDSSLLRGLGWSPLIKTVPGFLESSITYR